MWLQSVTNNTNNYITSTVSLSNSTSNSNGLVEHGTLSGVQILRGNSSASASNATESFEDEFSYITSMQDLLYTLFVAVVLIIAVVVVHSGESSLG